MRAGWGDEGSGADEDTGMDDRGILRKGKRQAFCPWQQKEEKSWKQQGLTHLKSSSISLTYFLLNKVLRSFLSELINLQKKTIGNQCH